MGVVVLGDTQAVGVAAYVAAVSGRRVHLVRPDAPAVDEVTIGGESGRVDVAASADLPAGDLEAVVVVTESRSLYGLLRPLAHRLAGVPVLLAPGGFAGALRVRSWFEDWGLGATPVAEATGFPASGKIVGSHVTVRSIKRGLPMASVDADSTHRLHRVFVDLLPQLVASDLVTTSLSNTNHMIHPGVVLLNASRVDNGEDFRFYRSGISPAVGHLLEAVDRERVQLARALGAEPRGVRDWLVQFYAEEGMAGAGIAECLTTFEPFAEVPAPTTLDYRYLLDDIPFGLAQWCGLARDLDLPSPHTDALLATLRATVPHLDLGPDPEAARLFGQHIGSIQGVTA